MQRLVKKYIDSAPLIRGKCAIYVIDEMDNIRGVNQFPGLKIDGDCGRVFICKGACFENTTVYFRNGGGVCFFTKSKYKITNLKVYLNHTDSLLFVDENFSCVKAECYLYEGKGIYIGKDNQWSFGIQIRNSDAHAIIDLASKECINQGKDVILGNHVWVASNVCILKGGGVGDNSIIGAGSVVTKYFSEQNIIIGGNPASCIKKNVSWERRPPF